MTQESMVGWCTLFLTIVGKESPAHVLNDDLDERERNHWFKGKKWAYANLNRLFVRYEMSLLLIQIAFFLFLITNALTDAGTEIRMHLTKVIQQI